MSGHIFNSSTNLTIINLGFLLPIEKKRKGKVMMKLI